MLGERGGEVGLRRLLADAQFGERRSEGERAKAFAGALAEVEEFCDTFELDAEWSFVGESECDRLAETAAGFNEDEFAADFLGRIGDAAEGDVGGELSKIGGGVGAQFRFVGGERAKSGFYLAEDSGDRCASVSSLREKRGRLRESQRWRRVWRC